MRPPSHTGWVKRADAHPDVQVALAAEAVSTSYAREICRWTDRMPEEVRAAADEILLGAAAAGLELADLAGLAAEMYEKSRQDKPDNDGGDGDGGDAGAVFDDRAVNLAATFGGAGVIHGDLTPECAEFVQTVLDALSAPAGAEDDRTHEQRYHDALQEAMRRLLAAGLLPERSGQPVKVWAHISLGDLMLIEGSSALLEEWTSGLRARWAGHRAAAAEAGGHQGLWLDGDAAEAITCDAAVAPVVTGSVDPGAFDDLVRLCVQLGRLRHPIAPGAGVGQDGATAAGTQDSTGTGGGADGGGPEVPAASGGPEVPAAFGGARSREALELAVIGKAVELLSGPGGLAQLPAPQAAGRAAGRGQPAAGHRVQRHRPGRDPQRGPAPRRPLRMGRRVQPARRRLPGPPHHPQSQRRHDQPQRLRPAVPLSPPGHDPPPRLDPGNESGRDDDGVE